MRSRSPLPSRPVQLGLLPVLCALLAAVMLPPSPAAARSAGETPAEGPVRTGWRVDLAGPAAGRHNIAHRSGGITVADARVTTPSAPGRSFAVYTAPAQSLGRLASAFTLDSRADVPPGTQVMTEVRGSGHPGTWTQWQTADGDGKLRLPEAVSVLQVRLTLLGRPDRTGPGRSAPSVSEVAVHAGLEQPAPRGSAAPEPGLAGETYRVFATREGLTGGTTANGHVIQPRDHFVALPSRRMLASDGGREYQVRLCYRDRCETAPVWDVGPWNTRDDYWNPAGQREMWGDLPQGTPEAQAAYQNGYNAGRDEFGRNPANPAGIDVADGTFWDGLGMTDNDWVDVTFQPVDGGPRTTVTAWTQANVRSCASTTCPVVSTVSANETYPANCWKTGQLVTAEGYTSDKWIELPLRAGGVGYISGIFLKGNETGGVTTQCAA
ncbi:SH3 domain-containing protein [Streptomyces sp. NPDC049577]|uniref:SH3 domain-containing protein n=1 Tax=Streptomyces sp. NPDC049577 TaxID=3155153 RepID=UPI003437BFC1